MSAPRTTSALLSLFFCCLALASPAAETAAETASEPKRMEAAYDFLTSGDLLLSADRIVYEPEKNRVEASGRVEAIQGPYRLTTERLIYDEEAKTLTLTGNVRVHEPSGAVLFAERAVLHAEWMTGDIKAPAIVFPDGSRLAAHAATRRSDNTSALYKAVYSPCMICPQQGHRTPLWRLKAEQVLRDEATQLVWYRHARLEMFGIPVFYLPVFWHPSPEVSRKTGLLIPDFHISENLGAEVALPFFANIAPHMDVKLTPTLTSKKGVLLKLDFRHALKEGAYRLSGSAAWPRNRAEGEDRFRGHIFGNGRFRFGENGHVGFDLQRTTDDTYLSFYDIYDNPNLTSRLFVVWDTLRHKVSLSSYAFQNLLEDTEGDQTPLILPLLNYSYTPPERIWGGRTTLSLHGSALARTGAENVQRVSSALSWELPLLGPAGSAYTLFAEMRGDVYHTGKTQDTDSTSTTRFLPLVGARWRFPLIRTTKNTSQVFEPVIQIVHTKKGGNDADIPNTDASTPEFDDTNLFNLNRFPGFDRWDSGTRLDAGLSFSIYDRSGAAAAFFVGQSFRLEDNALFGDETGLQNKISDIVTRITFAPSEQITLTQGLRFSSHDFALKRNETQVDFHRGPLTFSVSYIDIESDAIEGLGKRQEIFAEGALRLSETWQVHADLRRDLENRQSVENRFAVSYADECLRVSLSFKQDFVEAGGGAADRRIGLRIAFRNLGSTRLSGLFRDLDDTSP